MKMNMVWMHRPTLSVPTTRLSASSRRKHKCERTPKAAKTTPQHHQIDGQDNPRERGQPTLPEASHLPSSSSRDVGVLENVEAGTEGEHKTRKTALFPSYTATANAKHPHKDHIRQNADANAGRTVTAV